MRLHTSNIGSISPLPFAGNRRRYESRVSRDSGGIYPPGDFWAGSAVDIKSYFDRLKEMLAPENFGARGGLGQQFEEEMSEVVMEYPKKGYKLKFCRDGLILFKHDLFDWESTNDAPPQTSYDMWAKCYDICNCINLAFHSTLNRPKLNGKCDQPLEYPLLDFREIANRDVVLINWDDYRTLKVWSPAGKTLFWRWRRRQVVSEFDERCLYDMLRLRHAPVLK